MFERRIIEGRIQDGKENNGTCGTCMPYESGGERAEELIVRAAKSLEQEGMDLEIAHQVVWTGKDALEVCQQFEKQRFPL